MQKKYVIVGASAAGLACAERLRRLDIDAEIVCVAAQSELPYNTCLLSDVISGQKKIEEVMTKSLSFFEEHRIKLRLKSCVIKIESQEKYILLQDGTTITYDSLFLGTGRSAFVPEFLKHQEAAGIFPFHTLKDICNLTQFLDIGLKNIAVIGAGINGLEAADALVARGLKVVLLEGQDRLMPQYCDEQGSAFIEEKMKAYNIEVIKNQRVDSFTKQSEQINNLVLSNQTMVSVDGAVIAVGSRANIELVAGSGIATHGTGILVDQNFATNIQNIHAGGDICVMYCKRTQSFVQSCKWSDAVIQGMHAAHAMAGQSLVYQYPAITASSMFFGMKFVACGPVNNPPLESKKIIQQTAESYQVYLTDQQSRLIGFLLIGQVERVAELRKMVTTQAVFSYCKSS